jgi:hypothetical protein
MRAGANAYGYAIHSNSSILYQLTNEYQLAEQTPLPALALRESYREP